MLVRIDCRPRLLLAQGVSKSVLLIGTNDPSEQPTDDRPDFPSLLRFLLLVIISFAITIYCLPLSSNNGYWEDRIKR